MKSDKQNLSWKQQVEYRKVHSFFRDLFLTNKIIQSEASNLRITSDSNAQDVLNDL